MTGLAIFGLLSIILTIAFSAYTYYGKAGPAPGQTRKSSLIEAWTNVAIGFSINFVANYIVFPLLLDFHMTDVQNFWIGCIFTAISVVRSFVIRRYFNIQAFALRVGA